MVVPWGLLFTLSLGALVGLFTYAQKTLKSNMAAVYDNNSLYSSSMSIKKA